MRSAFALLVMLLISQPALAAHGTARASLKAFFAHGIHLHGATAALAGVAKLPNTSGRVQWHMPDIRFPASYVALIAEQRRGDQMRRWYVPVRLHWWANVVVANSDLPAASILSSDELTTARIDVADHPGHWWTHARDLDGMRLTRSLSAGEAIFNTDVQRPPLVRYGDTITLVATIGSIRVTTLGKVMDTAGRGDTVRVQNLNSKQMVQAVIVNKNTARIMLGGA